MSYRSWKPVVRQLEAKVAPFTESQRKVTQALGIHLNGQLPKNVVAAMIEDHLKPLIRDRQPPAATDRQLELLRELKHPGDLEDISASVASAWIEHHLDVLNLHILKEMKFKAGGTVALVRDCIDITTGEIYPEPRIRTISSIDRRGRLHFQGGGGQGAWPSQVIGVDYTETE
ncbi:hypothetical protein OG848_28095 [Streptomyces canus]|uniref:hypothetical protein n=1 Tax=Streptomyces canus TaxID=58343 RepID=UPI00324AFAD7